MKTMLRIGKNAPIHTTASGKVLLSSFSYRKVEEIIAEKGLERLTENTITTPEKLFGELALIRKRGYAVDDEECEIGHRCIAVPIYDYSGNVAGAISAFGRELRSVRIACFARLRSISGGFRPIFRLMCGSGAPCG